MAQGPSSGVDQSRRSSQARAAKAGIDDYALHLHANGNYWGLCTAVPEPNAVNQQGSTAKRRPVPGNTGATYALELIPAEGQSSCDCVDHVEPLKV